MEINKSMKYYIYTGIVPGLYLSYDRKLGILSNFLYFYTVFLELPSIVILNILDRIFDSKGCLVILRVEIIVPNDENIIGYLTSYSISNIHIEDSNYELFDGRFNQQT